MLEARGVGKHFGTPARRVTAVDGVSLRVERGEFVSILGRSGSGKSTLLAMLGGLCRPTQGEVILDGIALGKLGPDRLAEVRGRRIGFVFQFPSLLPSLRAIDNVALPGMLMRGANADVVYARAEQLLIDVGLGDRMTAYPGELSGGEEKRVAVARALINRPELLLADEPTSDLDSTSEAEVFRLLREHSRTHGTSVVVVTHNEELAVVADRVLRMNEGQLVGEEAMRPAEMRPPPSLGMIESPTARQLGAGFGRLVAGVAAWGVALVLTFLTAGFVVSLVQQKTIQARQSARRAAETAANSQLRADIDAISLGPDGSYRLTLFLQNLEPDRELFVSSPDVGVFIQVGRGWQEVPAKPDGPDEGEVIALTGRRRLHFTFTPGLTSFEEVLPGYMHVRVVNAMLVSPSRTPGDDLVERTDNYYVWLLPHGADLDRVARENGFGGRPPLWIPMPPH